MLKHLSRLNEALKSNDLASLIKTADLKNFRTLELEKKLNELSSIPNVYFHMAAINKFGLNPRSHYNTPIGIFTYPLNDEHKSLLLSGKLPYVTDQEYIHFASPKNPGKILRFEEDFLSDDAYNDLKEKLKDIFKDKYNPEEVGIAEVTSNLQTNSGKFWNVTRILSRIQRVGQHFFINLDLKAQTIRHLVLELFILANLVKLYFSVGHF